MIRTNPRTTVPFHAPEYTQASIEIYNILSQKVLSRQAEISAGSNWIQVALGGNVSQGQYIVRVQGVCTNVAAPVKLPLTGVRGFVSGTISDGFYSRRALLVKCRAVWF